MRNFARLGRVQKPQIIIELLAGNTGAVEAIIKSTNSASILQELELYIDNLLSASVNYNEERYNEIALIREGLLIDIGLGKKLKDDPKLAISFQKLDNFILSSPYYVINGSGRLVGNFAGETISQECLVELERIEDEQRQVLTGKDEELLRNLYNSLSARRRFLKIADPIVGSVFATINGIANIARTGAAVLPNTSIIPLDQRKRQFNEIARYYCKKEDLRLLGELAYQIDRDPVYIADKTSQSTNSALYYLPQSEWCKVTMRKDLILGNNPYQYYIQKSDYVLGHRDYLIQQVANNKPVPKSFYDLETMHSALVKYTKFIDMRVLRSPGKKGIIDHKLPDISKSEENRFVDEMSAIKVNGRKFFSRDPSDNPIVIYGAKPFTMTANTDDNDREEVVDAILQNYHKSIAAASNPLEELDIIARTFRCLYAGHFFGDGNGRVCTAILNHMLSSCGFPLRSNQDIGEFYKDFISHDRLVGYLINSMKEFNNLVVSSTGTPLPPKFTDKVNEAERLLVVRSATTSNPPSISYWNYPTNESDPKILSLKVALYIANMSHGGINDSRTMQARTVLTTMGNTSTVLTRAKLMVEDEGENINNNIRKLDISNPKFIRPDLCKAINVIAEENPYYDATNRNCTFKILGGKMPAGCTIIITNTDGIKEAVMRIRDRGIRTFDTDVIIKDPSGKVVTQEYQNNIVKKDEIRRGWVTEDFGSIKIIDEITRESSGRTI